MRSIFPRVAVAATAVIACLWYAASLQSNDRADKAINLAADSRTGPAHERALAAAARDFRASRTFSDDVDLLLKQSQGLVYGRNTARALPLLRQAVREEPQNVSAWVLLATAARRTDPSLARDAQARAVALDPRSRRYFGS